MARTLEPSFAAHLANDVYAIEPGLTDALFFQKYANSIDSTRAQVAKGVTGGYLLNKEKVFALYAAGKGDFAGQAFAAFKGTADLYDGLTDVNVGVKPSHTGLAVHQGFYYAFDSVRDELAQFVAGLRNVTTLHCLGHSLGGAVATLAADWVKAGERIAQVKLYTFGSPRVGLQMFAAKCTERLSAEHIFRAYHRTDPVPMLPTWPFFHVPTSEADYLLPSPVAPLPWEYHFMKYYIKSVAQAGSWDELLSYRPKRRTRAALEAWLASDGAVSLTANTLELLNAALLYVLEKAVQVAGSFAVTAFASTFTLLDRMAMFMAEAARISTQVGTWVGHLVRKMGALTGLVVGAGTALTVAFVRQVFLRLHHRIAEMVQRISRDLR